MHVNPAPCLINEHTKEEAVKAGSAILRYQRQTVEMICNQARWIKLGDYNIPTVNATSLWSEVGDELLRLYPEAPFVASWHQTRDCAVKYSLRSKGDFDVSEVAKAFGGGGHKNAAGFVL